MNTIFTLAIAAIMAFLVMTKGGVIEYAIAIGVFIAWKIFEDNKNGQKIETCFTFKELLLDIKDFGWSAFLIVIFVTLGNILGLYPFDNNPSAMEIISVVFVDGILLAIAEELFLRGIIQNVFEKSLFSYKKKEAMVRAILTTSFLYALGATALDMEKSPILIMGLFICRICMALYLGGLYAKTKNLLVPIIAHIVLGLGNLPFLFSTRTDYPRVSICICMALYIMLGAHGILMAGMKNNMD